MWSLKGGWGVKPDDHFDHEGGWGVKHFKKIDLMIFAWSLTEQKKPSQIDMRLEKFEWSVQLCDIYTDIIHLINILFMARKTQANLFSYVIEVFY